MKRTLTTCLIAVLAVGCQTIHQVPREEAVERYAEALSSRPGLRTEGYVSPGGTKHDLPSYARLVGDSFEFSPVSRSSLVAAAPTRIPRGGVEALRISRIDPAKSLGAAVGMSAVTVILAGGGVLLALLVAI